MNKLYIKSKDYDNQFHSWIDKKGQNKTSQYFPKPFENYKENAKIELDLSNYATKSDLKGAPGVHTSKLASKSSLASLKSEVNQTDIDKLKPAHVR